MALYATSNVIYSARQKMGRRIALSYFRPRISMRNPDGRDSCCTPRPGFAGGGSLRNAGDFWFHNQVNFYPLLSGGKVRRGSLFGYGFDIVLGEWVSYVRVFRYGLKIIDRNLMRRVAPT